jgi:hypothetical protein
MARLNPCPSSRDAFSLSVFSPCAPGEHLVQNAPQQRLKPILVSCSNLLAQKEFWAEKSPGAKARIFVGPYQD